MAERPHPTFENRCIISCGMLHPELVHLVETGFLNPRRILFTPPGLHALPENHALVDIVSERDLLYAQSPPATLLSGLELNHLLTELRVDAIMTRNVLTATPDTLVEDAARLMADNKIGGLPVVDKDNHVVGVITETDVFKAFIELYRVGHSGL